MSENEIPIFGQGPNIELRKAIKKRAKKTSTRESKTNWWKRAFVLQTFILIAFVAYLFFLQEKVDSQKREIGNLHAQVGKLQGMISNLKSLQKFANQVSVRARSNSDYEKESLRNALNDTNQTIDNLNEEIKGLKSKLASTKKYQKPRKITPSSYISNVYSKIKNYKTRTYKFKSSYKKVDEWKDSEY